MTATQIDPSTWDRAETFRFFRSFAQPHFSMTARVDVTRLMASKAEHGTSVFRACLWAVGTGINAVPELRTRFRGDSVTLYDRVDLSPVISMPDGSFRFAYIPYDPDRAVFDARAEAIIADIRQGGAFNPDEGNDAVAYLSVAPWVDFTALTHAMPDADDCIPRPAWGKIVPKGRGFDMALGLQVHHALADGRHAGLFFEATQEAFDQF